MTSGTRRGCSVACEAPFSSVRVPTSSSSTRELGGASPAESGAHSPTAGTSSAAPTRRRAPSSTAPWTLRNRAETSAWRRRWTSPTARRARRRSPTWRRASAASGVAHDRGRAAAQEGADQEQGGQRTQGGHRLLQGRRTPAAGQPFPHALRRCFRARARETAGISPSLWAEPVGIGLAAAAVGAARALSDRQPRGVVLARHVRGLSGAGSRSRRRGRRRGRAPRIGGRRREGRGPCRRP